MKTLISSPVLQSSTFVIQLDPDTANLLFYLHATDFYDAMESIEEIQSFDYDGIFGSCIYYTLNAKHVKAKTHSMIRDHIHSFIARTSRFNKTT